MKVILARNLGFCFGVKNSIDITNEKLDNKEVVFSYGPPIHNRQVINKLKEKGLIIIENLDDFKSGRLVIRSHGVPKDVYCKLDREDIELIDTTCPNVKRIHEIVNDYYNDGYQIIIIGDKNHPEIKGINGWCSNNAIIINTIEEINSLPNLNKVCVVGQTTMTEEKFNYFTNLIKEKLKYSKIEIVNTLCNVTTKRQEACAELAEMVDAMIIIGGYHSSNTKKLVDISKKYCLNTYHIETEEDLDLDNLKKFNVIGVSAGASTPDWIINKVVDKLNNI